MGAFERIRRMRPMLTFDPLYPPDPKLTARLIATAQILSTAGPEGYTRRALQCFRRGVIARQWAEQFQQFWLTIETIAEGSKAKIRIPIPCPRCGAALKCEQCGEAPLRRPMARQAIRDLI